MFVVDIPECSLLQDAQHIGDLEEDGCVGSIVCRLAHRLNQLTRVVDVLQRHLAAEKVAFEVCVLLGVEFVDEGYPLIIAAQTALSDVAGVNTDAVIVAKLAQQRQKLSLAAPNLDNLLVAQVIALDHVGGKVLGKGVEGGRVALRLLILLRVVVSIGVVERVVDKAARGAKTKVDITRGVGNSLLPRGEQHHAVDGHIVYLVKHHHIR